MLKIGLWQALAIIPGVSRSGATISGGISQKFEREAAAELGFLIGIPVIVGAGLKGIWDIAKGKEAFSGEIGLTAIGFVIAFVIGLVVIKYLLQYLKRNSLKPFIYYRVVLGVILLVVFLLLGR